MKVFQLVLILAGLINDLGGAVAADALQLQFANASLLRANSHLRAVYDGGDCIYIVPGWRGESPNLWKYTISTDELDVFGEFVRRNDGAAIYYAQDIIYLGGFIYDSEEFQIYRYSTVTHNYTLVNSLPTPLHLMGFTWDPINEFLYLFGGWDGNRARQEILRYNPRNNEVEQVGQLPEPSRGAAAVWNEGRAIIFPSATEPYVLEYDPVSSDVSRWPPLGVAGSISYPCAVNTGSGHSYLFAGPTWLKFDPVNKIVDKVVVVGWSAVGVHSAACVYVPALDRIYIFGGYGVYPGTAHGYRHEITYIDLDNSNAASLSH